MIGVEVFTVNIEITPCKMCKKPCSATCCSLACDIDDIDYQILQRFFDEALLCECGAEKCNTTHSDWCPKA